MSAVEVVRTPEERFADLPGYPFDRALRATLPDGLRMHYVDEGPAGAEAVLLLHGAAHVVVPVPHGGRPVWPSGACAPWRPT